MDRRSEFAPFDPAKPYEFVWTYSAHSNVANVQRLAESYLDGLVQDGYMPSTMRERLQITAGVPADCGRFALCANYDPGRMVV